MTIRKAETDKSVQFVENVRDPIIAFLDCLKDEMHRDTAVTTLYPEMRKHLACNLGSYGRQSPK